MLETIKYSPEKYSPENEKENKEFMKSPEIKLFGQELDKEMINYAWIIFQHRKFYDNKDNYDSLKSWQMAVSNIDKQQHDIHEQLIKKWLDSDFFNGKYYALYGATIFEQKYSLAKKYTNQLARNVYLPILKYLTKQEQRIEIFHKPTKQQIEIFKKLQQEGIIQYHQPDDIFDYKKISTQRGKIPLIFNEEVDKNILEYCKTKEVFGRLLKRYYSPNADSKKTKEFLRNADLTRTEFHRKILQALVKTGILPPIDQYAWLFQKWQDKQENKLRQISENFADMYVKCLNSINKSPEISS